MKHSFKVGDVVEHIERPGVKLTINAVGATYVWVTVPSGDIDGIRWQKLKPWEDACEDEPKFVLGDHIIFGGKLGTFVRYVDGVESLALIVMGGKAKTVPASDIIHASAQALFNLSNESEQKPLPDFPGMIFIPEDFSAWLSDNTSTRGPAWVNPSDIKTIREVVE